MSSGGVFDHHIEIAHQEVGRVENDKLIFMADTLRSAGQYHSVQTMVKKTILTRNQSLPALRPGSPFPWMADSNRWKLSLFRQLPMRLLSFAEGAIRNVA